MARPTKQGIDYFPLDCVFDDKTQMYLIEKEAAGLAVLITIWQLIYQNHGYYVVCDTDLKLLIKRQINVDENEVSECINCCLRRNIFNNSLYDKYKILTSRAIQKRFFEAAKKKKEIQIIKDFVLIPVDSIINAVDSDENPVNSSGNATKEEVKEEVKVKENTTRENVVSTRGVPIQEIVKKWNQFASEHQLPQTVKTTAKIAGQIRQRWKDDLPAIENWDNYFDYISKSKFLVGKTTPGNGRNKPFRATLEWVTKESNFAKIAAEEYH